MQSLEGKLVVVTRSVRGNTAWKKYLVERGAKIYEFPTIETAPVEPTAELVRALRNLADFDWIVFTSAMGLRAMREVAKKAGIDVSPTRVPPLTVIGPATMSAAEKMGYKIAFAPSAANTASLGSELGNGSEGGSDLLNGQSILLLRSDLASPELATQLAARGANVTDLAIYHTRLIETRDMKFEKLIIADEIDFLMFASPSAVQGFCKRLPDPTLLQAAKKIPAIAIGPSVEKILVAVGFEKILQSPLFVNRDSAL